MTAKHRAVYRPVVGVRRPASDDAFVRVGSPEARFRERAHVTKPTLYLNRRFTIRQILQNHPRPPHFTSHDPSNDTPRRGPSSRDVTPPLRHNASTHDTRTIPTMLTARANIASTSAFTASSARATTARPGRGALVVTAASKKKDVRLQVTLECTEQKESGVAGMSRYMTQKVGFAKRRMDDRAVSAPAG